MNLSNLRQLSAIALLALATPAFAQEEDTTEAPAEVGDAAPVEADPFDLGRPVEGELQAGEPYFREEFGDWALRCVYNPDDEDACTLYQLLLDQDGRAVAEFNIVPLPEGSQAAAGAIVVVPLETLLTEEVQISVDGSGARSYPFDFCNPAGCVARFGLTGDQVDQFRRGAAGAVRIVPALAPDQEVNLTLSLTGFTAGFTAANEEPEAAE